jgi:tetratricopeptide (TPR) repeat protein
MVALNLWRKALLVVLCLAGINKQFCSAQISFKEPEKWWPDPSTGLMWAEYGYSGPAHGLGKHGLVSQRSIEYCETLKLGGFSGWRIPTLDEVKGIAYTRHGVVTITSEPDTCTVHEATELQSHCGGRDTASAPHDQLTLKIPEWSDNPFPFATWVWTSTPSPYADKSAWIVGPYLSLVTVLQTEDSRAGNPISALCVRPMDADTLQIAKDAQVDIPVPDLQTLKAYVMLNKARLAYQAEQYQDSITQAQNALSIQGGLQTAYWGMGLSYGMLGQWDLAIANLNSAFKLNKDYHGDVYATLQWAKASEKAAKKGQKPKIKGKEWKSPDWNGPPWS